MGYFYKNTPVRHGIRQSIRLLDLFAGCGGMSQGFDRVGYTTVKVVENNPIAIETYSTNMLNHPIYPGDVTEFLRRCESNDDYRKLHGRIDHLHASPPCQGYSGANRLGGTNDQANINLTSSFLDAVRIFRPVTATFENVVGMWKRKHQHHLKNILAGLLDLGYQVRLSELIACDYGDPQARPRLFIFCARNFAVLPSLPTKIYGALPLIPVVTVKDVLERYLHLSDKERNSLPNMKGSKTTLKAGQHGVVQLDADRPCATLRASSTPPLHYSQDRCITVREAASLQSFPPTFVICGSIREQYRQIGNTVPVKLATAVARCVRDALEYEFVQESE
jgi:DNA (cytosine-5)-methyltransferase 1